MDELTEAKPGQAYNVLKKMGAQPGDCVDSNTFTLPNHVNENLSEEQSAERIADYFATISQEFPPLDYESLPAQVKWKIETENLPPTVDEFEVYNAIKSAKKPKSGIPGDLPRGIVQEFAPELATPLGYLINNILQSGEWPDQWKLEWVTAIGKKPLPETEDDLRPIPLTSVFSKVTEQIIVN